MNRSNSQKYIPNNLKKIGAILAVSSCKGGVGKSTVAAYLAKSLIQKGYSVGLVDADIYGPSIPYLFQLQNEEVKTNTDRTLLPIEKDHLKLMSFGFLLKDNAAVLRGPIATRYIQQMLLNTEWGTLDYLIIDMPPGTGDVHITIAQSIQLSGAVIVTTPHGLSLTDVARGILMFEKVNIPVLGVVENMAYLEQDSQKQFIFGPSSEEKITQRFGLNTLAQLPFWQGFSDQTNQFINKTQVQTMTDNIIDKLSARTTQQQALPDITCLDSSLKLTWNEKEEEVGYFDLRFNSQDALSVSEVTGERLINKEDIPKDIHPRKVTPLGNYALGIEWSDGHKSGIYSYQLISQLAKATD